MNPSIEWDTNSFNFGVKKLKGLCAPISIHRQIFFHPLVCSLQAIP